MSTLQHDSLFETCNDTWDIVPCLTGIGTWNVIETNSGAVHKSFTNLDDARKAREEFVMNTWEGLLQ